MHLFLYALVPKKEKLHWNSYTNFIPEVININFPFGIWQIWQILYFKVKGTGWLSLELSISLTQTVRIFDMWVTPYPGTPTFAKLKYLMLKSRVLRHYKVALLLIAQGEIQSIEQEMLSAKAKSDRAIQNFD